MIIVDYSQFAIAAILTNFKLEKTISEDIVRHILLNNIREKRKKFFNRFGELMFAIDSGDPWRKKVFPYYKANRKKSREASDLDWNEIYRILNMLEVEFKETFPYKFVKVPHTEGDDIIATICSAFPKEKNLILSSDKDFMQLQKFQNVQQYDAGRDKWLKTDTPDKFLMEHIIRGDSGDGVPNFLSGDKVFVDGVRQKAIMQKKVDIWVEMKEDEFFRNISETEKENYLRNKRLIDLTQIPDEIKQSIMEEFKKPVEGRRSKILPYFREHKMRLLVDCIEDF